MITLCVLTVFQLTININMDASLIVVCLMEYNMIRAYLNIKFIY